MVDAETLAEIRAAVAALPDSAGPDLTPLTSIPEVLAYVATAARSEGIGEADAIEMVARLSDMSPATARAAAAILKPMGFHLIADRLREIAGRRKRSLAPVPLAK